MDCDRQPLRRTYFRRSCQQRPDDGLSSGDAPPIPTLSLLAKLSFGWPESVASVSVRCAEHAFSTSARPTGPYIHMQPLCFQQAQHKLARRPCQLGGTPGPSEKPLAVAWSMR